MKNTIFATFCLLLGMTSCLIKDNSQAYQMTATVLDMDGKPIPNREVRVFVRTQPFTGNIFNDEQTFAVGVTDANGQVVLTYSLDLDNASQTVTVFATEDDDLRTVSVITYLSNSTKKTTVEKKIGTIQMDSLVPFTLRMKTDRVDVTGLSSFISNTQTSSSFQAITNIRRTFANVSVSTRTPKLDTLIATKVYSKAEFTLNSSMFFLNAPSFVTKGIVKFDKNQDRRGVFLQQF